LEFGYQVTSTLISGQVKVNPAVKHIGYTKLLRAVAEVLNAMSSTEAFELSRMIDINFAGVSSHSLCHFEHIGSSGLEEVKPQPQICRKLGVVPRIPADIISPSMSIRVIGMLYISMIPESVPTLLLNLSMVIVEQ
jgi:hypothetical protein